MVRYWDTKLSENNKLHLIEPYVYNDNDNSVDYERNENTAHPLEFGQFTPSNQPAIFFLCSYTNKIPSNHNFHQSLTEIFQIGMVHLVKTTMICF